MGCGWRDAREQAKFSLYAPGTFDHITVAVGVVVVIIATVYRCRHHRNYRTRIAVLTQDESVSAESVCVSRARR